jgi:hypothetical protein
MTRSLEDVNHVVTMAEFLADLGCRQLLPPSRKRDNLSFGAILLTVHRRTGQAGEPGASGLVIAPHGVRRYDHQMGAWRRFVPRAATLAVTLATSVAMAASAAAAMAVLPGGPQHPRQRPRLTGRWETSGAQRRPAVIHGSQGGHCLAAESPAP